MTLPDDKQKSWHDSLPFPKQWLVYIAIKLIVLALALFIVLRWNGVV
jgi:hypothetical protein